MYIKGTDYQGKQFSGWWNEKTYTSKEGEGLLRIYINNEPIHITLKEKKRILEEADEEERKKANERAIERAENDINSFFSKLRDMPTAAQYFALGQYLEHLKYHSNVNVALDLKKYGVLPEGVSRKQLYNFMDSAQECFLQCAKRERELCIR